MAFLTFIYFSDSFDFRDKGDDHESDILDISDIYYFLWIFYQYFDLLEFWDANQYQENYDYG